MKMRDLHKAKNDLVSVLSWVLLISAMVVSTLMANFAGWSTIYGLLIELSLLVAMRYILIYGITRDR
jgi:hypothetical protein